MLKDGHIKPRLATRYLIKAGGKGPKGNPVKWSHFKICRNERDDNGMLIPDDDFMKAVCGSVEPIEIPFMFFSNNPTDCYDDGYAYRTKTQRMCHSEDGITACWSNTRQEGEKTVANKIPDGMGEIILEGKDETTIHCFGPNCPMQIANVCKINLRLVGFIPTDDTTFSGADVFYSSSYNSAAQIRASLHVLISRTAGQIAFRPLILRIMPKKAMVANKQITVYIVDFYSTETNMQLQAGADVGEGLPSLAPPPAAVDFGDNEEIAEEYYPEEGDIEVPTEADMSPKPAPEEKTNVLHEGSGKKSTRKEMEGRATVLKHEIIVILEEAGKSRGAAEASVAARIGDGMKLSDELIALETLRADVIECYPDAYEKIQTDPRLFD